MIFKEEDLGKARDIALAILFHSASSPISKNIALTPMQQLVFDADDMDEAKDEVRHNLEIDFDEALERVRRLDMLIYRRLKNCNRQCKDCDGRVGELSNGKKR